ncbi:hypothetical protein D3C79_951760 [compost metagenome]
MGQLLLRQGLGMELGQQLMESGVGQLEHRGSVTPVAREGIDVNKLIINKPDTGR